MYHPPDTYKRLNLCCYSYITLLNYDKYYLEMKTGCEKRQSSFIQFCKVPIVYNVVYGTRSGFRETC